MYGGQERRKRSLVWKSDKKQFGRLTHRWKYDVKKWNEECIGLICGISRLVSELLAYKKDSVPWS
jgi:hypothetical protein